MNRTWAVASLCIAAMPFSPLTRADEPRANPLVGTWESYGDLLRDGLKVGSMPCRFRYTDVELVTTCGSGAKAQMARYRLSDVTPRSYLATKTAETIEGLGVGTKIFVTYVLSADDLKTSAHPGVGGPSAAGAEHVVEGRLRRVDVAGAR